MVTPLQINKIKVVCNHYVCASHFTYHYQWIMVELWQNYRISTFIIPYFLPPCRYITGTQSTVSPLVAAVVCECPLSAHTHTHTPIHTHTCVYGAIYRRDLKNLSVSFTYVTVDLYYTRLLNLSMLDIQDLCQIVSSVYIIGVNIRI